jgi:hypothetical protein
MTSNEIKECLKEYNYHTEQFQRQCTHMSNLFREIEKDGLNENVNYDTLIDMIFSYQLHHATELTSKIKSLKKLRKQGNFNVKSML